MNVCFARDCCTCFVVAEAARVGMLNSRNEMAFSRECIEWIDHLVSSTIPKISEMILVPPPFLI